MPTAVQRQTMDERLQHLARANEVRAAQAQILLGLKDGRITLAAALRDPDSARIRVGALLAAQRGWGESRVHRALHERHISPARRVAKLTDREIRDLSRYAAGQPWPLWQP